MEREWTAMNSWEEGLNGVTGKSPVDLIASGNQPPRALVAFSLVTCPYNNNNNNNLFLLQTYFVIYASTQLTNFSPLKVMCFL
jgi:hypothetical protein